MDTYEKKYKEALERAKQFSKNPLLEDSGTIVEYIFPELKESKDERIRKWIINDIQSLLDAGEYNTEGVKDAKKTIAWLKKQKQKPIEWRQDNVEELTEFEGAMMHIGGSFFGENAGLDPNDTTVIKEQAKLLTEMLPKKEWSEEDEVFLNLVIGSVNCTPQIASVKEGVIKWLKSLIQRIGG